MPLKGCNMKEIIKFSPDIVNNYNLFFIFDKIKASDGIIKIEYKKTIENEIVDENAYDLFEMNNDYLLVAFKKMFEHFGKYNYIAISESVSEIIPLQSFEKIYPYYKLGPEAHIDGTFCLTNSTLNRLSVEDWRCDNGNYGPTGFVSLTNPLFQTVNDIKIYEPIISVNGDAHIIYLKKHTRDPQAEEHLNNALTPTTTYTLAEMFKLVFEWAAVTEDPFYNTEEIAIKSKALINSLGLTEDLVSNQPDMQIFEYLKGNTSARLRPEGVQQMSYDLEMFIKRNSSFMCLSPLLACYPEAGNFEDVISIENEKVEKEQNVYIESFPPQVSNTFKHITDPDELYEFLYPLDQAIAFRAKFLLNIYKLKKVLIDKLDEVRNSSF